MAVSIRKRGKSYSAYWRESGKIREVSLGKDPAIANIRRAEIEKRLMAKRNGRPVDIRWDEFQKKISRLLKDESRSSDDNPN